MEDIVTTFPALAHAPLDGMDRFVRSHVQMDGMVRVVNKFARVNKVPIVIPRLGSALARRDGRAMLATNPA